MKIAPLMTAMSSGKDFQPILIHTGQHYDESMSGSFFRDLGIPSPQYHLGVGSGTHAQQTAEIMQRLEAVFFEEEPMGVLVVGDVNSTVAGALVAAKLGLPVIHAEAGLRSFDRSMPEEVNRVVTDAVSDLLLVTEASGRTNLLQEGKTSDQIAFVGNLMVDSLRNHLSTALRSDIRERLAIREHRFGLITLHRPANVDDEHRLSGIIQALSVISEELPLYWPVHPRTRSRLGHNGVTLPNTIHLLEPLGYVDFLSMQASCALVLTDSGGIQEESTVLGIQCLTLRDNTERPVTIECGTNRLAGTRTESILEAWDLARTSPKTGIVPPLWDGKAGIRSHAAIRDFFCDRGLRIKN